MNVCYIDGHEVICSGMVITEPGSPWEIIFGEPYLNDIKINFDTPIGKFVDGKEPSIKVNKRDGSAKNNYHILVINNSVDVIIKNFEIDNIQGKTLLMNLFLKSQFNEKVLTVYYSFMWE